MQTRGSAPYDTAKLAISKDTMLVDHDLTVCTQELLGLAFIDG